MIRGSKEDVARVAGFGNITLILFLLLSPLPPLLPHLLSRIRDIRDAANSPAAIPRAIALPPAPRDLYRGS